MTKKLTNIVLIIIIVALVGAGIYFIAANKNTPAINQNIPPIGEKIIKKVGEKESSFLIQKINSDSVEGLWHEIYPVENTNDPGYVKIIRIGDDIGYTCNGISEKLTAIDFAGQTITFTKIVGEVPEGGCPI